MANFTDEDGNQIGYVTYDMVEGETADVFVVTVTAAAGRLLRSGSHSAIHLQAREHGSGDPYVSLSSGIDLTPYAPGTVQFDIRAVAQGVEGRVRASVFLGVQDADAAAGWAD